MSLFNGIYSSYNKNHSATTITPATTIKPNSRRLAPPTKTEGSSSLSGIGGGLCFFILSLLFDILIIDPSQLRIRESPLY